MQDDDRSPVTMRRALAFAAVAVAAIVAVTSMGAQALPVAHADRQEGSSLTHGCHAWVVYAHDQEGKVVGQPFRYDGGRENAYYLVPGLGCRSNGARIEYAGLWKETNGLYGLQVESVWTFSGKVPPDVQCSDQPDRCPPEMPDL